MEELELLLYITMMMAVGGGCALVTKQLRLPTILGYLIAGLILGHNLFPDVPWLTVSEEFAEIFSTMGITLLMFSIGLELNLAGLKKIFSFALIIVVVEMTMMVGIGFALGSILGLPYAQALFLGVTIACASTAFSLSMIKGVKFFEGGLSKTVMGIHIMEDVALVIILAISSPIIGLNSDESPNLLYMFELSPIVETIVLIVVFIGLCLVFGLTFLPKLVDWVDRNYSSEMVFMLAIGMGFALSFASMWLGLSEAIGAFLAGIIVSQSANSHALREKVEPMKEMFMAIFFISIGMQLIPDQVIGGLGLAVIICAVFMIGKGAAVTLGCFAANFKLRSSFMIAASMVAMGEFTFVTAKIAFEGEIIDGSLYSSIVGAAVLSMIFLSPVFKAAPKAFDTLARKTPRKIVSSLDHIEATRMAARDRMAQSHERRAIVKNQLVLIFIDFMIILAALATLNVIAGLKAVKDMDIYVMGYDLVPWILFLLSVVCVCLPVMHIISRIRVIAATWGGSLAEEHHVSSRSKAAYAAKIIYTVVSLVVSLILLILTIPLLLIPPGLPGGWLLAIACSAMLILWVFWDIVSGAYGRLSGLLGKGILSNEADDGEGH